MGQLIYIYYILYVYLYNVNVIWFDLPGDKSDDAISETKSLSDEYEELVLSAASESDPLSSIHILLYFKILR